MKKILFVLVFMFFSNSSFAALPGQMNLKYGYQMFVLPTRDTQLWAEYEKVFFQDKELRLNEEEIAQIPEEWLERKTVKGVDRAYIADFLKEYIQPEINKEASESFLDLNEENRVTFTNNIQQGQKLNIPLNVKAIETALQNNIDEVELIIDVKDPILHISEELKKQGIQEIISIGESDFSGSSESRIHNIKTGIAQFQGKLIPADENFSFNNTLGPVHGGTGYKKELVIKGDETVADWGGGICQVSSTLFRGVMLAGLGVNTRRNHSYAVSYYSPAGSDATIYLGSQDFQFTNNTGKTIALNTFIDDKKLYFVLLGTKTNTKLSLFGPHISETKLAPATRFVPSKTLAPGEKLLVGQAHTGFTALWIRQTNDNIEKFTSVYQPRPKVYKVGGLSELKIGEL